MAPMQAAVPAQEPVVQHAQSFAQSAPVREQPTTERGIVPTGGVLTLIRDRQDWSQACHCRKERWLGLLMFPNSQSVQLMCVLLGDFRHGEAFNSWSLVVTASFSVSESSVCRVMQLSCTFGSIRF
jgi:hypothetical protein